MAKELTKEQLQEENAALRQEIERLKDELIRLVGRNLDLTERLEEDVELRRVGRDSSQSSDVIQMLLPLRHGE